MSVGKSSEPTKFSGLQKVWKSFNYRNFVDHNKSLSDSMSSLDPSYLGPQDRVPSMSVLRFLKQKLMIILVEKIQYLPQNVNFNDGKIVLI